MSTTQTSATPGTNDPVEKIYTNTKRVACDGGGGALGHPRVWLEMGGKPFVECPYCGRHYILSAPQGSASAHDSGDHASHTMT